MNGFIKSFGYAFSGVVRAVKTERNLRIHFSVAALIIAFAYFFKITDAEWAILFLTIGFVISAELFNTSLERCADAVTEDENVNIKYAKDIAAGAVVISAITSVATGIAIFGKPAKIIATLKNILGNRRAVLFFVIIFTADILFMTNGKRDGMKGIK